MPQLPHLWNGNIRDLIIYIKVPERVPSHISTWQMLSINLIAIILIFCSLLRKTYSCLLHVIHYWYSYMYNILSIYGEMFQSSNGFSKLGSKEGDDVKTQVLIPDLPLNCYLTLGNSLNLSLNFYFWQSLPWTWRPNEITQVELFFKSSSIPVKKVPLFGNNSQHINKRDKWPQHLHP